MLALLAGLAGAVCLPVRAAEPVAVQFTLDRPIDAVAAPFVMAQAGGLFSAEGLNVTTGIAASTHEAIARVASGATDLALVDINALIRHRDKEKPDAPHARAVFVLFNQAGYSIIARKSRGIQALADLSGKSLGVVEGDPAAKFWPAVAKQNGIKLSTIKQSTVSPAVREPMLSAGQVDAVTGSSFLSAINLKDRGVPADDLLLLKFADYGSEAYGYAIVVNPGFAAAKPEAVKAFIRAAIGGLQLAIKEPTLTVAQVVSQMDGGTRELELERLRAILRDNVLTPEVRRNGLGGIDAARFEKSIEQIAEDFKFSKRPTAADIFDGSFLPPLDGRLIN
ncbi:ABC transporter substrate-binding protein [Bradyrhizobium sp.]|uniref:ABC transporter substrate-binding protein n=1 Tax=Bradyrhizobium sp. TaxID=376 RepID=UPI0025BA6F16|nr:ABC transporter substrate-binding protein [Bradyrhizobium sp.]